MTQIGARDQLILDLIAVQDRDPVLNAIKMYPTERLINFTPEDPQINPPTPQPCRSIELFTFEPEDEACAGGTVLKYSVIGRVQTYIDPKAGDENFPSLHELGERQEEVFQKARLQDNFPQTTKYAIKNFKVGITNEIPYRGYANGKIKLVSYAVKTEFKLDYEVKL